MNKSFKRPENVIIVGGGIAGLMCARELLNAGHIVTILEASQRLGGRIHTLHDSAFKEPVEKGVEFIHGNLPLTIQLLKEAAIEYKPVRGDMARFVSGEWKMQDDFSVGWDEILRKMNDVRDDITMNEFLELNFSDERYNGLRRSVLRFAEGFDLADPSKASVLALREEWMGEEGEQYRIPEGFDQLVNYLATQCVELGGIIQTSSAVTEITWQKNDVIATGGSQTYYGNKAIITIPLGLLQKNAIIFQPGIAGHLEAATRIGFGTVVKILLEFDEPFWREKKKNLGFLFTDEIIPTWWTQLPSSYPLLTGWAGGPQAWPLQDKDDSTILQLALQSLSNVFQKPVDDLQQLLTASLVTNWRNDPYTNGAYSYSFVGSAKAQELFNTPIEKTIFFAGEAFYDGPSPGTVEAALVSAKNVVDRILSDQMPTID
jgi:monoamine oxidase